MLFIYNAYVNIMLFSSILTNNLCFGCFVKILNNNALVTMLFLISVYFLFYFFYIWNCLMEKYNCIDVDFSVFNCS